VFVSAALLIKLLARKSLLDWQGLVLAAPRAPAQNARRLSGKNGF